MMLSSEMLDVRSGFPGRKRLLSWASRAQKLEAVASAARKVVDDMGNLVGLIPLVSALYELDKEE